MMAPAFILAKEWDNAKGKERKLLSVWSIVENTISRSK